MNIETLVGVLAQAVPLSFPVIYGFEMYRKTRALWHTIIAATAGFILAAILAYFGLLLLTALLTIAPIAIPFLGIFYPVLLALIYYLLFHFRVFWLKSPTPVIATDGEPKTSVRVALANVLIGIGLIGITSPIWGSILASLFMSYAVGVGFFLALFGFFPGGIILSIGLLLRVWK